MDDTIDYLNEVKYSKQRLLVLFMITFFIIAFWQQAADTLSQKILYAGLLLTALGIVSLIHYFFILRYPDKIAALRKTFLLLLDLAILTFLIALFEKEGLYLFPLYIIINMQTGLYFGMQYFYISLITTSVSWIVLLFYSPYWAEHFDIVAVFAVTTYLISLLYLNYIIKAYEVMDTLSEQLSIVSEDAYHDSLTGLANRKTYTEELKNAFKEKSFFALIFIDLNKFKTINDTHGHDIGDEVLKEVARRLLSQLNEEDFLARFGGDEFAIISRKKKVFLPKLIEKLEGAVIGYHTVDGKSLHIELSIGISLYPDDTKMSALLGKYADIAMYAAKKREDAYHVFYKDISADKHPDDIV
ncbi:hypothetical protein YH65_05725 [Sulfurovum lithotrophicum]|uniref:GGDEF domain-containing protein n=1 Tax=Sulfurovum lithotrophicum TaxID=206403 RepID=A0A7U4RQJ6_9BACT|nr:diguanylate cyclase [Sulfurovum lithotrophicum]AKF24943.1 hypothetical protein YH65_05725 [Sulfurovum lithotrophicum]